MYGSKQRNPKCHKIKDMYIKGIINFEQDWWLMDIHRFLEWSLEDPCVFRKAENLHPGIHANNNIIIGKDNNVKWLAEKVKKAGLNMTVDDKVNNYLSWKLIMNRNLNKAWIGKPHIIDK